MKPVISMTKGIIGMIADREPLNLNITSKDLYNSGVGLLWRARFPLRMPNGVVQKAQDLLNKVNARVEATDVTLLSRKTMSQLGKDMEDVVDAIEAKVENSPDGIYTDYLESKVGDKVLEDALYDIGLQLKAYQIDIINYRDLANTLLGLPIVPHVVGGINTAVSTVPNGQILKDITQALIQQSGQATSMARNVVQQGATSVSALPGVSSISNIISVPMTSAGNAVLNTSGLSSVFSRFVSQPTLSMPSATVVAE